jgi:mannitol/fructose-specific phosphotransferase system IIA component (Ntr-type)
LQTTLLTKENILLQQDSTSWQEAIKKAAQPLLRNGSVSKQYVEAMIQSVLDAGPYIVLMPGFALAHARSEDGVCRLAAIDPTSHLELMSELAEVLARDNIIDRLANVETPEAFIKLLEETRS